METVFIYWVRWHVLVLKTALAVYETTQKIQDLKRGKRD